MATTKALTDRDQELLRATADVIKKQMPASVAKAISDYIPAKLEASIGPLRAGLNQLSAREKSMHFALVELESRLLVQIEFLHDLINGTRDE